METAVVSAEIKKVLLCGQIYHIRCLKTNIKHSLLGKKYKKRVIICGLFEKQVLNDGKYDATTVWREQKTTDAWNEMKDQICLNQINVSSYKKKKL